MKALRMLACLLLTIFVTDSAVGLTTPRLDIVLEGPWTLYPYLTDTKVNVLVAVAPFMDDPSGPHSFHRPMISGGDGFFLYKPGIYCLTFNSTCAKATKSTALHPDKYPGPAPLKVYLKGHSKVWDLAKLAHHLYALILPMPDSYSNDGIWNAQFSDQFDGKYVEHPAFSIGVELHYVKGASNFNILQCDSLSFKKQCSTSAVVDHRTNLFNTGTLRIEMKSPNNDDPCDPHVRGTHRDRLLLLDDTDIKSINNVNHNIAYINPALSLDDYGNGVYDGPPGFSCHPCDPQSDNPTPCPQEASPAPVVTSKLTAHGTVNSPFSYQITATNSPDSYGATPLPSKLTVDRHSGLISGTPSAAGDSTVKLTATKGALTGKAILTLQVAVSAAAAEHSNIAEQNASVFSPNSRAAMNMSLSDEISDTGKFLNSLNRTDEQKRTLFLPEIADELIKNSSSLSDTFPSISQITWIEYLVNHSMETINTLQTQLDFELKSREAHEDAELLQTLNLIGTKERLFLSDAPTKNGNDCRAAIMLVQ